MLTDKEIKGLKPKADKKYLVADAEMLFVVVYPSFGVLATQTSFSLRTAFAQCLAPFAMSTAASTD